MQNGHTWEEKLLNFSAEETTTVDYMLSLDIYIYWKRYAMEWSKASHIQRNAGLRIVLHTPEIQLSKKYLKLKYLRKFGSTDKCEAYWAKFHQLYETNVSTPE